MELEAGGVGPLGPASQQHRLVSREGSDPQFPKGTGVRRQEPVPQQPDRVAAGELLRQFEVDPALHRVVVKVLDGESGEVIRQVPPKEAVAIAKFLDQVMEATLERRV